MQTLWAVRVKYRKQCITWKILSKTLSEKSHSAFYFLQITKINRYMCVLNKFAHDINILFIYSSTWEWCLFIFRAVEMLRKRELSNNDSLSQTLALSPMHRDTHTISIWWSFQYFFFNFWYYKNNEIHLNKFSLIIDADT